MNQDELREFAECEGGAFGECDPADPRWSWRFAVITKAICGAQSGA